MMSRIAVGEHIVGHSRAIPTLVAVHRIETPGDAGDRALPASAGQFFFEPRDIGLRGTRRRIATVEKRVDRDRHAGVGCSVDEREQMPERAVHATVRQQTHEVQRSARTAHVLDRLGQHRIARQRPGRDVLVDDDQALRNDAAAT